MADHGHIIKTQILDVHFNNKEKVAELQEKLSELCLSKLPAIIEEVISSNFNEDTIVSIDTINVNIGNIPYHNFENELLIHLKRKLDIEFSKHITQARSHESSEVYFDTPGNKQISIFSYFITSGVLPWWALPVDDNYLETLLAWLTTNENARLIKLLKEYNKKDVIAMRIAQQVSSPVIEQLVSILEPAYADAIISYKNSLIEKQEKEQFATASLKQFEATVWGFILTYLLEDKGSYFNTNQFVDRLIYKTAAYYNMAYLHLLKILHEALPFNIENGGKHELTRIISELFQKSKTKKKNPDKLYEVKNDVDLKKIPHDSILSLDDIAFYFLLHGTVPVGYDDYTPRLLEGHLMKSLHAGYHESFITFLNTTDNKNSIVTNILTFFSDDFIWLIIRFLNPTSHAFIQKFTAYLQNTYAVDKKITDKPGAFTFQMLKYVLLLLLSEKSNTYNHSSLIYTITYKLAANYNIRHAVWLKNLYTAGSKMYEKNDSCHLLIEEIITSVSPEEYLLARMLHIKDTIANDVEKTADIVFYFLLHDKYPSSYNPANGLSARDMLSFLFTHHPGYTIQYMAKVAGNIFVIKRIVDVADDKLYTEILHSLSANNNHAYSNVLQWVKQQKGKREKIFSADVIEAIQIFVLAYLFKNKIYAIRKQPFKLADLVSVVSSQKSISKSQFSDVLTKAFNRAIWHKVDPFLQTQIDALRKNNSTKYLHDRSSDQSSTISETPEYLWSNIEHYLYNDKLPWWTDEDQNISVQQIFYTLFTTYPAFLSNKIIAVSGNISAVKKIVAAIGDAGYKQLLGIIAPGSENTFLETRKSIINSIQDSKLIEVYDTFTTAYLLRLQTTAYHNSLHLIEELFSIIAASAKVSLTSMLDFLSILSQTASENKLNHVFFKAVFLYIHQSQDIETHDKKNIGTAVDEKLAQAFSYFLQHGELPTSFSEYAPADFVAHIHSLYPDYVKRTLKSLLKSHKIRVLIVRHNDPKLFLLFITIIAPSPLQDVITAIKNMRFLLSQNVFRQDTSTIDTFWLDTLEYFSTRKTHSTYRYVEHMLEKSKGGVTTRSVLISEKTKEVLQQSSGKFSNTFIAAVSVFNEAEQRKIRISLSKPKPTPSVRDESAQQDNKKSDVFINNAGIVILAPFLGTYYKRLELMKDSGFSGFDERVRATHLLQYLANGSSRTPEYELILNKILCGVEMETPIQKEILISEKEKEISDSLLLNVIQQWNSLGNTSIEGLRQSFLMRSGKLVFWEDKYELVVEQKAYDILLTQLPWSISLIKYSWMNKPLYVRWK